MATGNTFNTVSAAKVAADIAIETNARIAAMATQHTADLGTYALAAEPIGAAAQATATAAQVTATANTAAAPMLGPRFLFLGDSITAGAGPRNGDDTQSYWGGGFTVSMAMVSAGQIILSHNSGIPGNNTAQMLARFDADVGAYAAGFDCVFLLTGTNDPVFNTTWTANMAAIIAKIQALGKRPILATIPPTGLAAPRPANITLQNAWIRRFGIKNNIPVVDFYRMLIDPLTGTYKATWCTDLTHPQPVAQTAMGVAALATLAPLLAPAGIVRPWENADPNNLVANGCFVNWTTPLVPPVITIAKTGSGGSLAAGTYFYKVGVLNYYGESLPSNEVSITIAAGEQPQITIPLVTGQRVLNIYRSTVAGAEVILDAGTAVGNPRAYLDDGSKTPGAKTPATVDSTIVPTGWGASSLGPVYATKITDPAVAGFAARLSPPLIAGSGLVFTMSPASFNAGDTIAITGMIRCTGVPVTGPAITFKTVGGATNTWSVVPADVLNSGWGTFYAETVIPVGATAFSVNLGSVGAAVGTVDFAQVGAYNLTTMGVL